MAENFYTQLGETGIIIPDTSNILEGVQDEFTAVFGSDMDVTTPETPQGRLIETIASERANVLSINAENANQLNLDNSTGVFLDSHGTFFRVPRIGEESTRVLATVTGVAGTVIKAGSLAKTTADDQFYSENDITIAVSGSSTGYFLSAVKGVIPCDIGTLTTIVSSTSTGWETIANPVAATLGSEREGDTAYRARIKASRYSGSGFLSDIAARVNAVENIESAFCYDNGTDTNITYDTVVVEPHSIVVIADGGADADIAQAIFETKSAGCGYTKIPGTGTVIFTGNPTDGQTVTIDGRVYTFKDTIAAAYDVHIGIAGTNTSKNLEEAIMAGSGAGTDYGTGTIAHPTVTAVDSSGTVTLSGGTYGVVLCSDTADNVASAVTAVPCAVTQSVTDGAWGVSYPVTFNRPRELQIDVEVTAIDNGYSGASLSTAIKDAVVLWAGGGIEGVDGLKIGTDVSPFEIAAAVSVQIPEISITNLKICLHGGSLAATTLTIRISEIGRIVAGNITTPGLV